MVGCKLEEFLQNFRKLAVIDYFHSGLISLTPGLAARDCGLCSIFTYGLVALHLYIQSLSFYSDKYLTNIAPENLNSQWFGAVLEETTQSYF